VKFVGTGRGNPVGAPLEAVIQDLCSTRKDLAALLVEIRELRAEQRAQNTTIVELLTELVQQTRDGITEAQTFRGETAQLRVAAAALKAASEEVRDELRTRETAVR
jgi:uncharacterized coiled-coil DUF342 family protein